MLDRVCPTEHQLQALSSGCAPISPPLNTGSTTITNLLSGSSSKKYLGLSFHLHLLSNTESQLKMSATPLALAGALGGLGYLLLRTQTDDVFRDLSLLVSYVRVARFAKANLRQGHTVVDFFESARRKNPQGEALIYIKDNGRCRSYTFQEVDELSNKVANWALQEGVQPQDVVVVLMDNRPEFIITWLGLAKVGAISALINTNLRGAPLLHTLSISKAKHFIIGMTGTALVAFLLRLPPQT